MIFLLIYLSNVPVLVIDKLKINMYKISKIDGCDHMLLI